MDNPVVIMPKPATPAPRGGRRRGEPKLDSLRAVRQEMALQYRRCVYRNEIGPEDLAKIVFCLRAMGEMIAATDFEDRLNRLEVKK